MLSDFVLVSCSLGLFWCLVGCLLVGLVCLCG